MEEYGKCRQVLDLIIFQYDRYMYLRAVLVLSMVDEYLCAGVSVAVQ